MKVMLRGRLSLTWTGRRIRESGEQREFYIVERLGNRRFSVGCRSGKGLYQIPYLLRQFGFPPMDHLVSFSPAPRDAASPAVRGNAEG